MARYLTKGDVDRQVEVRPAVSLRKPYDFFRQHAGGIVGHDAIYALRLARAELRATIEGYAVEWRDDPDGRDTFMNDQQPAECLVALLVDPVGRTVASLGGIGDPDRDYRRVVAAELALEAGLDQPTEDVP